MLACKQCSTYLTTTDQKVSSDYCLYCSYHTVLKRLQVSMHEQATIAKAFGDFYNSNMSLPGNVRLIVEELERQNRRNICEL